MTTVAERRALQAVADDKVTRVYRRGGNVLRGPKGISAATLWRLDTQKLIRDGRERSRGLEITVTQELTAAGLAALGG